MLPSRIFEVFASYRWSDPTHIEYYGMMWRDRMFESKEERELLVYFKNDYDKMFDFLTGPVARYSAAAVMTYLNHSNQNLIPVDPNRVLFVESKAVNDIILRETGIQYYASDEEIRDIVKKVLRFRRKYELKKRPYPIIDWIVIIFKLIAAVIVIIVLGPVWAMIWVIEKMFDIDTGYNFTTFRSVYDKIELYM